MDQVVSYINSILDNHPIIGTIAFIAVSIFMLDVIQAIIGTKHIIKQQEEIIKLLKEISLKVG